MELTAYINENAFVPFSFETAKTILPMQNAFAMKPAFFFHFSFSNANHKTLLHSVLESALIIHTISKLISPLSFQSVVVLGLFFCIFFANQNSLFFVTLTFH
jgi:hypothetical protein